MNPKDIDPKINFRKCDSCKKDRILEVSGKCNDLCFAYFRGKEHDGCVPCGFGVGGGDYLELSICLDCGKVQGKFPKEGNPLRD